MTNQRKLNEFRSIMVEEIKFNVKSIYTKLFGEIADDESYVLKFSDITEYDISVVLKGWCDEFLYVVLDTIVLSPNDIYMTGHLENGECVEEIYFESLTADKIATIADILWNKNYKL